MSDTPRVTIHLFLSFLSVSQYAAAFMVISLGIKSTNNIPFWSQKIVAMIFLSESWILNFLFDGEWV
jgi:hypothetical protein